MTNFTWHIPFKGKNTSTQFQTNFLCQHENIFIMDNHRMALWCWLQKIDEFKDLEKVHFFHVDAHYDSDSVLVKNNFQINKNINLNDYVNNQSILWDNYIPLFFNSLDKDKLGLKIALTHEMGLKGSFDQELKAATFLKDLDDLLLNQKPWIFNLDLDYFFPNYRKDFFLFSQNWMMEVFKLIKLNLDEGHIRVLTIALSPECCGGWEQANEALTILCNVLKIQNPLP